MYATKEAIIAKEHAAQVKPTIFYMDIRAHGKGFDTYYERARDEYGVRYIRCQVSKIVERPKSKNLMITYISEENKVVEEEFDLIILSMGMSPSLNSRMLADKLDIALDHYGFCQTDPLQPTATSRPGIYVCGAFEAPKDIPENCLSGPAVLQLLHPRSLLKPAEHWYAQKNFRRNEISQEKIQK